MKEPMREEAKMPFIQFNLGHLLTIVSIVGSVVLLYGQRERDNANMLSTLESHSVILKDHGGRLNEMDRQGTMASTAKTTADHNLIVALTARVDSHAVALNKVETMATDITWIKLELQRKRAERD